MQFPERTSVRRTARSTRSAAPQSLAVENTGGEVLRVTAADIAGDHPDDFLKTAQQCTGASLPPGGLCAIRLRFAPSATVAAQRRRCGCATTPSQGTHVSRAQGTRDPPRRGGGGTGPAGPAGPTGPTGASRRDGRGRADRSPGAPGAGAAPRARRARRARPGRRARPAATPPCACKPKKSRSGKVRVTCTVRFVSARRATVRARLVRGNVVYASTRRAVRRGRVSLRVRPTTRLRHARYRLLLTFTDKKGRATTLAQRVTLR